MRRCRDVPTPPAHALDIINERGIVALEDLARTIRQPLTATASIVDQLERDRFVVRMSASIVRAVTIDDQ